MGKERGVDGFSLQRGPMEAGNRWWAARRAPFLLFLPPSLPLPEPDSPQSTFPPLSSTPHLSLSAPRVRITTITIYFSDSHSSLCVNPLSSAPQHKLNVTFRPTISALPLQEKKKSVKRHRLRKLAAACKPGLWDTPMTGAPEHWLLSQCWFSPHDT